MDAIFPKGNADTWNFAITNYLPNAMSIIMKTVDPIVCAALLALTGNSAEYSRDTGSYRFMFDTEGLPSEVSVMLTYDVPSMKVPAATPDAVAKDRAFILAYLQQAKGFKLTALELNNQQGKVKVAFSVKVGYSND